jgi:hypothetical protein
MIWDTKKVYNEQCMIDAFLWCLVEEEGSFLGGETGADASDIL